jgi:hypothetical protein
MIKESKMSLSQRVLGAVDLAIEFATLGEYGLEQTTAHAAAAPDDHGRRERPGLRVGHEARANRRRSRCEQPLAPATCLADAQTARR